METREQENSFLTIIKDEEDLSCLVVNGKVGERVNSL